MKDLRKINKIKGYQVKIIMTWSLLVRTFQSKFLTNQCEKSQKNLQTKKMSHKDFLYVN